MRYEQNITNLSVLQTKLLSVTLDSPTSCWSPFERSALRSSTLLFSHHFFLFLFLHSWVVWFGKRSKQIAQETQAGKLVQLPFHLMPRCYSGGFSPPVSSHLFSHPRNKQKKVMEMMEMVTCSLFLPAITVELKKQICSNPSYFDLLMFYTLTQQPPPPTWCVGQVWTERSSETLCYHWFPPSRQTEEAWHFYTHLFGSSTRLINTAAHRLFPVSTKSYTWN